MVFFLGGRRDRDGFGERRECVGWIGFGLRGRDLLYFFGPARIALASLPYRARARERW